MTRYMERVVDSQLRDKLETFGAVNIVGPKWCGKTKTAEQQSKSAVYLQSDPNKEGLRQLAKINPQMILDGESPRLIDEWQDAPEVWDAVRYECDHRDGPGHFILTGSTSKKVQTSHTGTGRISELMMYPMSLFESGESSGAASLQSIFDGDKMALGCSSELSYQDLVFASCRGGWPYSLGLKSREAQLSIAQDYHHQIYSHDMFQLDDVKRNPETMKIVLRSYARNISTLAKTTNILSDVKSTENLSIVTLNDYLDVLRRLYIIQELDGWTPSLRSSSGVRSGPKREFVDPSLAVSALGTSPEKLQMDPNTFGFIFECLCIRDLRVYSSKQRGSLSYYRDRYGLESDSVLHLKDGRYALIEFKLGEYGVDEGAKHLLKIQSLIEDHNNENNSPRLDTPSALIVMTGTKYGYRRPDGVYVIPVGCLGP